MHVSRGSAQATAPPQRKKWPPTHAPVWASWFLKLQLLALLRENQGTCKLNLLVLLFPCRGPFSPREAASFSPTFSRSCATRSTATGQEKHDCMCQKYPMEEKSELENVFYSLNRFLHLYIPLLKEEFSKCSLGGHPGIISMVLFCKDGCHWSPSTSTQEGDAVNGPFLDQV